jgi:GNAT superfamily N-acetyltransferase
MAEQTQNTSSDFTVSLRPTRFPADVERTVAIYNTWSLEPMTVERALEWEAGLPTDARRYRSVAESRAGEVVGYGEATHKPWAEPGLYEVEFVVDTLWRGRGVGAALWRDMLAWLRAEGATRVEVQLRDNDPAAIRFAEARSFTRERHRFESTLDLASFDERPFVGALTQAQAEGYRFFSPPRLRDQPPRRARHPGGRANLRAIRGVAALRLRSVVVSARWADHGGAWRRVDGAGGSRLLRRHQLHV